MTSNRREPRLPKRAEELLEGWPAPSRGALEWEESASSVVNRVRRTEIGSTPDDLLGAPLPEEPDERGRGAPEIVASEARPAEPSLAEIARAALSAREATTREVAREGLIAAELGRKNPPREAAPAPRALVDAASLQGRVARVPEPSPARVDRPPPPPKIAKHAEPAAVQVAEATAHSELPAPPSRERRRIGAILGSSVLAFAAAAALYLSFARHEAPEAPLTASAEAPATVAKTEPPTPEPKSQNAEAEVAPNSSAVEQPVARLDDVPLAAKSRPSAATALPPKEKTLSFHVKKESAPNAGKLVLEEQNDAPAQNAAPSTAGGAARSATAAQAPTSETPSTGAVQAALGSVLTSARGCLAGQDTGARALVTFEGRTGRVKSVTVAGAEPGSPAESCVRSALMGARLPPFSEPSFTASITVRPL
ncbi:MAG TPA: hypothetical protein VHC69_02335 [Polyangiaceae bacterium]|nr:hypothetical protein [Polyangiaceae bacterium]